jgi:hypothetical protein
MLVHFVSKKWFFSKYLAPVAKPEYVSEPSLFVEEMQRIGQQRR